MLFVHMYAAINHKLNVMRCCHVFFIPLVALIICSAQKSYFSFSVLFFSSIYLSISSRVSKGLNLLQAAHVYLFHLPLLFTKILLVFLYMIFLFMVNIKITITVILDIVTILYNKIKKKKLMPPH